jgi:serine/threonine-protein kinase
VSVPAPSPSLAQGPTLLWKTGPTEEPLSSTLAAEDGEMRALVGRDLGVYRCESLIGRGGMGWVFLALHRQLHRHCALKILAPRLLAQESEYLNRFHNEGRAAAALVHPNVVTTHAIGHDDPYHYLEMEFIPGRSLQDLIDAGPITPIKATAIAAQVAAGLAAAHRHSILHRDVKPDNILLTHTGVPKIGDFGLAKRIASRHAVGRQEELAGTPNFMAPEIFAGEPATPASDVYSLGVCFFLMLTGRLPFARPRLTDLMSAVASDTLPNIREMRPEVSLEMCECTGLLMSRAPENRPRDGNEAMQLLQAVLGQIRDLQTLVAEALEGEPSIRCERTRRGCYRLTVPLPDGRQQTVYLEEQGSGSDCAVTIYSNCSPVRQEFLEPALRLNATVCHGALAIRDLEDGPHFVMTNAYPRSTVDPEEIRRSVLEIAAHSDAVERRLTGIDSF